MAKLPTQKKILIENFPKDEQKWIGTLLEPLNRFMEEVSNALNNQLRIAENFDGDVKTVLIDGTYPFIFKNARVNRPKAVLIGQCREATGNHTVFTDPIYLDWEMDSNGLIQINDVVGLTVSSTNKYQLTLVLLAG